MADGGSKSDTSLLANMNCYSFETTPPNSCNVSRFLSVNNVNKC